MTSEETIRSALYRGSLSLPKCIVDNKGSIDEEDLIKAIVDKHNGWSKGRASLYGTCEGKCVEGVIKSNPSSCSWTGI
jgi:hypothetical protein